MPQAPQLSGSVWVSAHFPLHCVRPTPQTHCPAVHVSPAAQLMPHAPQFVALVCRSTHVPSQVL